MENVRCLKGTALKATAAYYEDYCEFEGILEWMISNSEVWKQMGINARAYIDKYYQWDVIIEKISALFNEIIDETGGSRK